MNLSEYKSTHHEQNLEKLFYSSGFMDPNFLSDLDDLVLNENTVIELDHRMFGLPSGSLTLNNYCSHGIEFEGFIRHNNIDTYLEMEWSHNEFKNEQDPIISLSFSIFKHLKSLEKKGNMQVPQTLISYKSHKGDEYNYHNNINAGRKNYKIAQNETNKLISNLFPQ